MKEKLKEILAISVIILIFIICIIISNKPEDTTPIPYSKWSDKEKVEYLEEEIDRLKENIVELNSRLDDVQHNYYEDEDLIEILRTQLLNHGIEPNEL